MITEEQIERWTNNWRNGNYQKAWSLYIANKAAEWAIKECLSGFDERIATRLKGSQFDCDVAYGMEIVTDSIKQKFRGEK